MLVYFDVMPMMPPNVRQMSLVYDMVGNHIDTHDPSCIREPYLGLWPYCHKEYCSWSVLMTKAL